MSISRHKYYNRECFRTMSKSIKLIFFDFINNTFLDLKVLRTIMFVIMPLIYFDIKTDNIPQLSYFIPLIAGITLWHYITFCYRRGFLIKDSIKFKILRKKKFKFFYHNILQFDNTMLTYENFWYYQIIPTFITILAAVALFIIALLYGTEESIFYNEDLTPVIYSTFLITVVNMFIFSIGLIGQFIYYRYIKGAIPKLPLYFDDNGKYQKKSIQPKDYRHRLIIAFETEYKEQTDESLFRELIYLKSINASYIKELFGKIFIPVIISLISIFFQFAFSELNFETIDFQNSPVYNIVLFILLMIPLFFIIFAIIDNPSGMSKKEIIIREEVINAILQRKQLEASKEN